MAIIVSSSISKSSMGGIFKKLQKKEKTQKLIVKYLHESQSTAIYVVQFGNMDQKPKQGDGFFQGR